MRGERKLYNFEEKRMARLLQQAASAHIRRNFRLAEDALSEILAQLDWAERKDWSEAGEFVARWLAFVQSEREGESLSVAPAAWIHLGQELSLELEKGQDWIAYLRSRWAIEQSRLSPGKRILYGVLGVVALGLSALIIGLVAHEIATGRLDAVVEHPLRADGEGLLVLLLTLARVAGTFLMVEHGFIWLKRGLSGKGGFRECVFFGGGAEGLSLVE